MLKCQSGTKKFLSVQFINCIICIMLVFKFNETIAKLHVDVPNLVEAILL